MTFLSFVGRILLNLVMQPGSQDVLSKVGKYAARQATAAIIRHVRNATATNRKTVTTIR